ncbi:uncharacterized protein MONOS_6193 [Monocercomonoides exilis]|uniref:uncharacterized protein n=1 Tax=Monocercomonoides exilis TaxID=2049356 RepID=UPI003559E9DB|nr:hypothetical protein MONOS_6193 [Monocercomonoides exilis]|eukprot:MONOS_6193.1-p1 / transcript=MONOS_6193.1 / gene=MONOS_6193 / organism=Monocercomonoides_exilis_PA203 / gene_product=unspecified product / transcript_product=unspecified product / location=Mono_scaffold00192:9904-15516(-) / protein_length=1826 / sequence_SO=supercontig / SO=protein_coding / is_pseudo=false
MPKIRIRANFNQLVTLFSSLWVPQSKKRTLNIADTIIFAPWAKSGFWMFTDELGKLRAIRPEPGVINSFQNYLCMKYPPNSIQKSPKKITCKNESPVFDPTDIVAIAYFENNPYHCPYPPIPFQKKNNGNTYLQNTGSTSKNQSLSGSAFLKQNISTNESPDPFILVTNGCQVQRHILFPLLLEMETSAMQKAKERLKYGKYYHLVDDDNQSSYENNEENERIAERKFEWFFVVEAPRPHDGSLYAVDIHLPTHSVEIKKIELTDAALFLSKFAKKDKDVLTKEGYVIHPPREPSFLSSTLKDSIRKSTGRPSPNSVRTSSAQNSFRSSSSSFPTTPQSRRATAHLLSSPVRSSPFSSPPSKSIPSSLSSSPASSPSNRTIASASSLGSPAVHGITSLLPSSSMVPSLKEEAFSLVRTLSQTAQVGIIQLSAIYYFPYSDLIPTLLCFNSCIFEVDDSKLQSSQSQAEAQDEDATKASSSSSSSSSAQSEQMPSPLQPSSTLLINSAISQHVDWTKEEQTDDTIERVNATPSPESLAITRRYTKQKSAANADLEEEQAAIQRHRSYSLTGFSFPKSLIGYVPSTFRVLFSPRCIPLMPLPICSFYPSLLHKMPPQLQLSQSISLQSEEPFIQSEIRSSQDGESPSLAFSPTPYPQPQSLSQPTPPPTAQSSSSSSISSSSPSHSPSPSSSSSGGGRKRLMSYSSEVYRTKEDGFDSAQPPFDAKPHIRRTLSAYSYPDSANSLLSSPTSRPTSPTSQNTSSTSSSKDKQPSHLTVLSFSSPLSQAQTSTLQEPSDSVGRDSIVDSSDAPSNSPSNTPKIADTLTEVQNSTESSPPSPTIETPRKAALMIDQMDNNILMLWSSRKNRQKAKYSPKGSSLHSSKRGQRGRETETSESSADRDLLFDELSDSETEDTHGTGASSRRSTLSTHLPGSQSNRHKSRTGRSTHSAHSMRRHSSVESLWDSWLEAWGLGKQTQKEKEKEAMNGLTLAQRKALKEKEAAELRKAKRKHRQKGRMSLDDDESEADLLSQTDTDGTDDVEGEREEEEDEDILLEELDKRERGRQMALQISLVPHKDTQLPSQSEAQAPDAFSSQQLSEHSPEQLRQERGASGAPYASDEEQLEWKGSSQTPPPKRSSSPLSHSSVRSRPRPGSSALNNTSSLSFDFKALSPPKKRGSSDRLSSRSGAKTARSDRFAYLRDPSRLFSHTDSSREKVHSAFGEREHRFSGRASEIEEKERKRREQLYSSSARTPRKGSSNSRNLNTYGKRPASRYSYSQDRDGSFTARSYSVASSRPSHRTERIRVSYSGAIAAESLERERGDPFSGRTQPLSTPRNAMRSSSSNSSRRSDSTQRSSTRRRMGMAQQQTAEMFDEQTHQHAFRPVSAGGVPSMHNTPTHNTAQSPFASTGSSLPHRSFSAIDRKNRWSASPIQQLPSPSSPSSPQSASPTSPKTLQDLSRLHSSASIQPSKTRRSSKLRPLKISPYPPTKFFLLLHTGRVVRVRKRPTEEDHELFLIADGADAMDMDVGFDAVNFAVMQSQFAAQSLNKSSSRTSLMPHQSSPLSTAPPPSPTINPSLSLFDFSKPLRSFSSSLTSSVPSFVSDGRTLQHSPHQPQMPNSTTNSPISSNGQGTSLQQAQNQSYEQLLQSNATHSPNEQSRESDEDDDASDEEGSEQTSKQNAKAKERELHLAEERQFDQWILSKLDPGLQLMRYIHEVRVLLDGENKIHREDDNSAKDDESTQQKGRRCTSRKRMRTAIVQYVIRVVFDRSGRRLDGVVLLDDDIDKEKLSRLTKRMEERRRSTIHIRSTLDEKHQMPPAVGIPLSK